MQTNSNIQSTWYTIENLLLICNCSLSLYVRLLEKLEVKNMTTKTRIQSTSPANNCGKFGWDYMHSQLNNFSRLIGKLTAIYNYPTKKHTLKHCLWLGAFKSQ